MSHPRRSTRELAPALRRLSEDVLLWRFAHNHPGSETGAGACSQFRRVKETLRSPTYLQGRAMAAYLSPAHKGFGGPLGQRSLEAQPVLCGTKAERGRSVFPRRGRGGKCATRAGLPRPQPHSPRPPPGPGPALTLTTAARRLGSGTRAPARGLETWHRGQRQTPGFRRTRR